MTGYKNNHRKKREYKHELPNRPIPKMWIEPTVSNGRPVSPGQRAIFRKIPLDPVF